MLRPFYEIRFHPALISHVIRLSNFLRTISFSNFEALSFREWKRSSRHPPSALLPEQKEIVRRVEDLFAFADRIEARLATAQKTVERLTPATLAKAFRGELVPQDSDDEPASILLERLRRHS